MTAYALFVDGTLLIYEGIREHAKGGFLLVLGIFFIYIYIDKYFRTIFIKLIPCYELSIAICSPYGRKTAHDIVHCALPTKTAG